MDGGRLCLVCDEAQGTIAFVTHKQHEVLCRPCRDAYVFGLDAARLWVRPSPGRPTRGPVRVSAPDAPCDFCAEGRPSFADVGDWDNGWPMCRGCWVFGFGCEPWSAEEAWPELAADLRILWERVRASYGDALPDALARVPRRDPSLVRYVESAVNDEPLLVHRASHVALHGMSWLMHGTMRLHAFRADEPPTGESLLASWDLHPNGHAVPDDLTLARVVGGRYRRPDGTLDWPQTDSPDALRLWLARQEEAAVDRPSPPHAQSLLADWLAEGNPHGVLVRRAALACVATLDPHDDALDRDTPDGVLGTREHHEQVRWWIALLAAVALDPPAREFALLRCAAFARGTCDPIPPDPWPFLDPEALVADALADAAAHAGS